MDMNDCIIRNERKRKDARWKALYVRHFGTCIARADWNTMCFIACVMILHLYRS